MIHNAIQESSKLSINNLVILEEQVKGQSTVEFLSQFRTLNVYVLQNIKT